MIIKTADSNDTGRLIAFYTEMCRIMEDWDHYPDGNKALFPPVEMIEEAVAAQTQFIAEEDGRIAGAYMLDHHCDSTYADAGWSIEAGANEFAVMHALRVSPDFGGRSVSAMLIRHALETAREWEQKAVRLDVLAKNDAAVKLYLDFEFKIIKTVNIYYDDIGQDMEFLLMEYIIDSPGL